LRIFRQSLEEEFSEVALLPLKSEEAMRASEEFRSQSQSQTSVATGAGVTTERFEVFDHT
jgi:hypothetical protein